MIERQSDYSNGMFDNHLLKPIQSEKLASVMYLAFQRKKCSKKQERLNLYKLKPGISSNVE